MLEKDSLRKIILSLAPTLSNIQLQAIISARWNTGKPLEWLVLFGITKAMMENGWLVRLNNLAMLDELSFVLNNQIPLQHVSLSGRSGVIRRVSNLAATFLASLSPKAIATKGNRSILIFKEGNPYLELLTKRRLSNRPDLVFVEGRIPPGYPRLASDDTVEFQFECSPGIVMNGEMQLLLSRMIPLTAINKSADFIMKTVGVLECTLNKTPDRAREQIAMYSKMYSLEPAQVRLISTIPILEIEGLYLDMSPSLDHLVKTNNLLEVCRKTLVALSI